jgi:hypothetical protein
MNRYEQYLSRLSDPDVRPGAVIKVGFASGHAWYGITLINEGKIMVSGGWGEAYIDPQWNRPTRYTTSLDEIASVYTIEVIG